MDKYEVYHSVESVRSMVEQYPMAKEFSQELSALAQQLSTRTYRVAVIGEFKRGKSSLVNCILGTEVLPTDILPSTAVVNRVVYSNEKKIEIHYKNGDIQQSTVEELSKYATKENEANAAMIREIVVCWPAVFCQNQIQILDTPGLNDDEFMDRTTLDVLDKIDTAIVTTHAIYPVSETEKKLICRLIEQDDIYHLTFVATFIDRVADDREEQDEIVELVRQRLSKDTYQMFCKKHPNEPKLLEKARRILSEPVVFGVSSRLAMNGFIRGDKRMLEESRFPHFKYELLSLLTANQELDMQQKAARMIRMANEKFPYWHEQFMKQADVELAKAKKLLQQAQTYQQRGCPGLMDQLIRLDQDVEKSGIVIKNMNAFERSDMVRAISWTVMRELMQIDPRYVRTMFVEKALSDASKKLKPLMDSRSESLIQGCMQKVNQYLLDGEKNGGLGTADLEKRLAQWNAETPFPQLDSAAYDLLNMVDKKVAEEKIRSSDPIALANWIQGVVCSRIYPYFSALQEKQWAYIATWRSQILKQNAADKARAAEVADFVAGTIRALHQKKNAAEVNFDSNKNLLAQIDAKINHQ